MSVNNASKCAYSTVVDDFCKDLSLARKLYTDKNPRTLYMMPPLVLTFSFVNPIPIFVSSI